MDVDMVQVQSKSQSESLPEKSSSVSQTTPLSFPDPSNPSPSEFHIELNSPIWTRLPVELVFATLLHLALSLPVTAPLPPIPTRSTPPSPSLDGPSSPTNDEMLPKAAAQPEHHERHEHEQLPPHHLPITSRKDLLLLSSSVRRLVSPTIYTSLVLRTHAQVIGFGALFLPKRPVFGQLDPVMTSLPWTKAPIATTRPAFPFHPSSSSSSLNPNAKHSPRPIPKPKPISLALPLPPSLPSLESTLESLASHGTFSALQSLALTPAVHAAHGYWMRRWVRPRAVMIFQVAGGCGAGGGGGGAFGGLTGGGAGAGAGGRRTYGGRTEINWRDRTFSNVEDLYTCTLRGFGTSDITELIIPSSNPTTVVLPNSVSGHGEGKLKRIALWCDERRLNHTLNQIENIFFKPQAQEDDPFHPTPHPHDSPRPAAISFLDMIVLHVRPHSPDVDKAGLESGEGIGWMGVFGERVRDGSGSGSGRRRVDFLREERFFVCPDMTPVRYRTGRMEWKSVVDGGLRFPFSSNACGDGEHLGTGDLWARAKEWRALAGEGYENIIPPLDRERERERDGTLLPFRYDFGFSFIVGPNGTLLPSPPSTSTISPSPPPLPSPPPPLSPPSSSSPSTSSIPTTSSSTTTTTPTPSTPHPSRLLKLLQIWNATEAQYRTARFRGGEWDVELGAEGMEGGGAGSGGWAAMSGSGGVGGGGGWRTDTPWPGP